MTMPHVRGFLIGAVFGDMARHFWHDNADMTRTRRFGASVVAGGAAALLVLNLALVGRWIGGRQRVEPKIEDEH